MPTTLLTPAEAAKQLKISRQMVLKYMADGRIPVVPLGDRKYIDARYATKKPEPKKPGPKPKRG